MELLGYGVNPTAGPSGLWQLLDYLIHALSGMAIDRWPFGPVPRYPFNARVH